MKEEPPRKLRGRMKCTPGKVCVMLESVLDATEALSDKRAGAGLFPFFQMRAGTLSRGVLYRSGRDKRGKAAPLQYGLNFCPFCGGRPNHRQRDKGRKARKSAEAKPA